MSELSYKIMEKVKRIYLARQAGILGVKCVAILAALSLSSLFVSFTDVMRNARNVLGQGDIFGYVAHAFMKTEAAVLILSALIILVGIAAVGNIRKMVAGFDVFIRQT